MKLYNTLTKQKEEFTPIDDNYVGMYSCGPTVYDYAHIGNLRKYVVDDLLKRWLTYTGYKVNHIMNITDVGHLVSDEDTGEDKIEKGSKREGKSAHEIAKFYTDYFFAAEKKLNILKPDNSPIASEHIKEQIQLIRDLEKDGYTYKIDDGIYFDTSKFSDYGKLASLDIEGLKAGARVEMVKGKRSITDFALWKFSPKDEKRQMEWESPWGVGFPGWHIECSAMSMKYLGNHFDIHTGGIDHVPVHHTNEIAQSEAATGEKFVNYWVHAEFLLVDGQKMSKSKSNFYTLEDLQANFKAEPLAFRLMCLMSHYREKLNFTEKSIVSAQNTLNNLRNFILRLQEIDDEQTALPIDVFVTRTTKDFCEAMDDDLNSPKAIAAIFDFIKEVNKLFEQGSSKTAAMRAYNFLLELDKVLGLELANVKTIKLTIEEKNLIAERDKARKDQDWTKSDSLRDKLIELGFEVEDTTQGTKVRKAR